MGRGSKVSEYRRQDVSLKLDGQMNLDGIVNELLF